MECLPKDPLLQFNPDTLEHVRKLYDLDNPVRIKQAIEILEEWIKKQHHFTRKEFDADYLERILVVSKGSIERAKSQLDAMCTFRTLLPKFFFTPSNLREDFKPFLDVCWIVPMPKLTKNHHRVFVLKLNTSDFKAHHSLLVCKWLIIVCEYLKSHDYFEGIIAIADYRTLNLPALVSMTSLTELQEMANIIIKGFGARIKEIHIINESKLLDFLLQIGKQLVSQKILSRATLHHDVEPIYEYVDPSILPVELGGTERSLDTLQNEWLDVLSSKDHVEYVTKMNEARTDETQRLAENFNSLYMGTPGSFRNLIVD
ncbi:hypothetical protein K1T71_008488 [Dendrolimus kikuchii]|uniref:Uncharacterized protein n=1 Tax=Dendrolimus kikuchii TaxID=765133 RepID=A0ACC1CX69_9NEOP|nr:hypothetical protein K1T71_008488 [Dendrolimus kikuchii]